MLPTLHSRPSALSGLCDFSMWPLVSEVKEKLWMCDLTGSPLEHGICRYHQAILGKDLIRYCFPYFFRFGVYQSEEAVYKLLDLWRGLGNRPHR